MKMTNENLYVAVTAFYALSLTHFDMPTHSHNSLEIMYVTKGSCKVKTNDQEYLLKERQFIYLNTQTPHRLMISGEQCSILNLEFQFQKEKTQIHVLELLKKSKDTDILYHMTDTYRIGNDTKNVGYALKDFISHLTSTIPYTNNCRNYNMDTSKEQGYLLQLLFLRMMLEVASCLRHDTAVAGLKYLKKACNYITEHLTEEIRIPAIAESVGINKSYLHLLFSQYFHCTITEYINRKRLEQAVFLLRNSTLSITEIAFHTGYNNRQHFGNMFEKYYKMSPKAYRQLHGKNKNVSTGVAQVYKDNDGSWKNTVLK